MRHHRVVRLPALWIVVANKTGNRVCHRMGNMHAGITEADTGQHAGEHQFFTEFGGARLLHRFDEVGTDQANGFQRREITIRVGTLVDGACGRIRRLIAAGIGNGRVGLAGMGKDVETIGSNNRSRQAG